MIRSGFKRAKLLKKVRYFHSQGENCFFSTLYFGTEPYLLYFGNNVVIGAGSVVTSDVPDNCMITGVPAKKIGDSSEYFDKVERFSESVDWDETMPLSARKKLQNAYFWKESER